MFEKRLWTALIGSAAAAMIALATAPAFADELSDLKAQVEALMNRIEQLEVKQAEAEKAPPAPARMVTSGNDKVSLTLSGQVNRVSFFADDGTDSTFFHSDNENSSTRWRLIGRARIDNEWTVGTKIEQDIGQTNNSASVTINQQTSVSDVSFDNRHLTVWLESKRLGRLWIGKGDTASNNITQLDLSGTSVIEYSGLEDIGGSLRFRANGDPEPTAATDAAGLTSSVSNPQVSGGSDAAGIDTGAYSQFDGLSRRNRIQYDTPTIRGFKAGVSTSQGDAWDATLRYKARYKEAGLKLAAGIGYWEYGRRSNIVESGIGGSISALHDSGANLTISAGTVDRDGPLAGVIDDPSGYFIKPGWQIDLTPLGKTAVSAHYARTDDFLAQGDEFTSFGLAVVQHIDKAATELFAFYRQYDLDRTGAAFEEIDIAGVGARVKF